MSIELLLSIVKTPIGDLTIVTEENRIVICEFSDHEERVARQLQRFYGGANITRGNLPDAIALKFKAYFAGDTKALDGLQTAPAGSPFDKRVWQELRKIPTGATTHYGAIAKKLASSPRAVGGANGRNPVALIHPCHRVIGANGSLTGYAGGMKRKEWLLQHEGALLPV